MSLTSTFGEPTHPDLAQIRRLLCVETPAALVEAVQALSHTMEDSGIQSLVIDSPGLGRWSWGQGGLPLIDADLEHQGRGLGRFRIGGNESAEGGALVCRLSPVLIPLASRLLAIQEAEQRAMVDALTGILNRTGLEQRLSEELHRSRRHQTPLSLLMIDMDDLKQLNDQMGHESGDRALCKLADVLQSATRGSDVVGRFGGDEFLVILPETDLEAARLVAARVRIQLEVTKSAPKVSIGITEGIPQETRDQLVRRADQAMYRVKRQGRDGVAAA
ncbi:diguanylate cyclase (GGDEF)-like protein [Natronospira proteinivora]|uniref:diguanylate cyclase n=1 Tax=Natronospira proteinivora TaxID=1807133 RepID=A0ABT1G6G0_9GAMM|nr:GGDEF domain-containing protein [Natronospira proteinivora]MCP1726884.1 diguanylate cyclase (GGDEF)-like protein [Natronospira proteinivora]